jgi:signal transduction histidine kinase/CheY-like chemotaxis protein/HPt (histidine-containing phosphotransfer) domain-containing protein
VKEITGIYLNRFFLRITILYFSTVFNPIHPMKKVSAFVNALPGGISKPSLLSWLMILILFGGIFFNYYVEQGVNHSVAQHNRDASLIVKHEHYKQVIDKVTFDLSKIDYELNQFLLTPAPEKQADLLQQIQHLKENVKQVRDEATQYVPKYLVNIFHHKVRNRTDYQRSVITTYELYGKDRAVLLLNNLDDQQTNKEYVKSQAELTAAVNTRIKQLNDELMKAQAATLSLDRWWNIGSLILMLAIAFIVLYQTTRIHILNRKLGVAFTKMKQATRVKDQFMSNITHELRTPLNSILGYTHLLLKKEHQPETEKWLQAVHSSGTMLLDVVNDVLDYSKLESGYLQMAAEAFQLDDVLSNLRNIMINRAESKALSLVILKDHSLPQNITGDEKKLKQILINLTGNAIKFTEKGTVKIEVSLHRHIGEQYWIQFKVSDTGIGISPENLPHVFDRFYQVENSYSRKYSGTGLGLPIVKQLVDLQGGSITATSLEGAGTSFTIIIPFEAAAKAENSIEAPMAPVHKMTHAAGKRILIVDDHELNRDLMVLLLKEYKYHAVTATNGYEALELLKKKHFDLVLMDVQMPELNGIETTLKIRNLLALDIPVIACTAFSQPSEKKACFEAGMNDYLGKPVEERELMRLLHQYLGQDANEKHMNISLINFKQIQGITGNNKELMAVMLHKAMEAVPEELEQLHQYIQQKKYHQMCEQAHTTSSTLGLMGAPEQAMLLVKKIQQAGPEPMAHETLLNDFYELNNLVEQLMIEIRHYLAA